MFKFLSRQTENINTAAIIIAGSSLVSRLLGVLRDRILASEFGAGKWLDMYYAAFRIPDTIFNLLVLGAISAGFIPVFIELLQPTVALKMKSLLGSNHDENYYPADSPAWKLANAIINLWAIGLVVVCVILIIFTPRLMVIVAPGFSGEELQTTINLTRIMFLSPIFLGLSAIYGGILQSLKKFFIYSIAPIIYNIGIMIGAIFLVPFFGIYGLAYGVVIGTIGHLLVQLPAVFGCGYRYEFILSLKDKLVQKILKLMAPRIIALAVSQVNLFVVTVIASTLAAGSLSVFNFAANLSGFPVGIFAVSLAVAALPSLSERASANDLDGVRQTFSKICRQILFWLIPATVILVVLRMQIVRAILGAGLFDWEDTISTADCLALFSMSLFAQGLLTLQVRTFFALQDTKTPFIVAAICAIFNIGISFYLSKSFGVLGLAAAFSLSNILNFVLLWALLKIRLAGLLEKEILSTLFKLLAASLNMGLSMQIFKFISVDILPNDTFLGIAFQGALSLGVGTVFFLISGKLLHLPELEAVEESLRHRWSVKIKPPVEKMEN